MARLIGSGWKKGDVRIWTKPIAEIPKGWQLADGTNGTLNLVDRVPAGAGGKYASGELFGEDVGAVENHTLSSAQIPSHSHGAYPISSNRGAVNGNWFSINSSSKNDATGDAGGNSPHKHGVDKRQASTAVYWIQKVI